MGVVGFRGFEGLEVAFWLAVEARQLVPRDLTVVHPIPQTQLWLKANARCVPMRGHPQPPKSTRTPIPLSSGKV